MIATEVKAFCSVITQFTALKTDRPVGRPLYPASQSPLLLDYMFFKQPLLDCASVIDGFMTAVKKCTKTRKYRDISVYTWDDLNANWVMESEEHSYSEDPSTHTHRVSLSLYKP